MPYIAGNNVSLAQSPSSLCAAPSRISILEYRNESNGSPTRDKHGATESGSAGKCSNEPAKLGDGSDHIQQVQKYENGANRIARAVTHISDILQSGAVLLRRPPHLPGETMDLGNVTSLCAEFLARATGSRSPKLSMRIREQNYATHRNLVEKSRAILELGRARLSRTA